MIIGLLKKLRGCQHQNTNAFEYVRDDGILEDALDETDPKRVEVYKLHLTGLRFCLDCGSTQRFKHWDPLSITDKTEKQPWIAPWLWRKQ